MSRKYSMTIIRNDTDIRNDTEYDITLNDNISSIRHRIDELENRVTKLEEKGDTVQRKTKHRRIVIKL